MEDPRTWYERNRDRILEMKRLAYQQNTDLRERKQRQALERYYKNKEKRGHTHLENGSDFLQQNFLQ